MRPTNPPADLPEPMVPAEVDLRGLEYMPLLGDKLFSSDFALHATDAEFRAGLQLWWKAWSAQVPAGSLPDNERAQAKLAGFEDEKSKGWRSVKARALDGFQLCSDGRLYHPVLAKQALIAWDMRVEAREERDNAAERQRRTRIERRRLFSELKQVGVVPDFKIPMEQLRALHASKVTPTVTVTRTVTDHAPVTVTDTATITAKTGRDGTSNTGVQARSGTNPDARTVDNPTVPDPAEAAARALVPPALRDPDPPDDPDRTTPPVQPTPAGAICRALRQAGVQQVNPAHPTLIALLDAGATEAEFIAAAAKARGKANPFAYALSVVLRERQEAAVATAGLHRGPIAPQGSAREQSRRAAVAQLTGGMLAAPTATAPPGGEIIDMEGSDGSTRKLA